MITVTKNHLAPFDVAAGPLTDSDLARAAVALERILATDPHAAPAARRQGPPRRSGLGRLRDRRLLLVPAAGLAAAAVTFAVPWPGGMQAAYATWTPTPTPMTSEQQDLAVRACAPEIGKDVASLATVLAERRGDIALLVAKTPGSPQGGPVWDCHLLWPASEAEPTVFGVGGMSGFLGFTDDGDMTVVQGDVSAFAGRSTEPVGDVTVIVDGERVTASVVDGWFAAWWPQSLLDRGDGSARDVQIEVSHADGSVETTDLGPAG